MLLPRKRNRPKGILSHTVYGSCFCVERRDIFPVKNMKYKYHISCQFVETTHLRLICMHTENAVMFTVDKKKPKKKLWRPVLVKINIIKWHHK